MTKTVQYLDETRVGFVNINL